LEYIFLVESRLIPHSVSVCIRQGARIGLEVYKIVHKDKSYKGTRSNFRVVLDYFAHYT